MSDPLTFMALESADLLPLMEPVKRLAHHMGAEALLELLTKMADRGDDLALKGGNADTVIRARWHAGRHMESRFDPDYRIS